MSWNTHLEILHQAARAEKRFVVMESWPHGVPCDRQSFEELVDALDYRDELRKAHDGRDVFFGVVDREDDSARWLEHADLYQEVDA